MRTPTRLEPFPFYLDGLNALPPLCHNGIADNVSEASTSNHLRVQNLTTVSFLSKHEFVDGGDDDDLDPAMKEELDQ
ncbi:hypothetical protein K1719_031455 [Acacia pycnantha]|nr:hypothetical protein K1719_031455 [Acacia pycnantha]